MVLFPDGTRLYGRQLVHVYADRDGIWPVVVCANLRLLHRRRIWHVRRLPSGTLSDPQSGHRPGLLLERGSRHHVGRTCCHRSNRQCPRLSSPCRGQHDRHLSRWPRCHLVWPRDSGRATARLRKGAAMEAHKASDTAALTAMLRAAHQLVDGEPKIVDDPIAVGLLDDAIRERIAARPAALFSPGLMIPRAAVLVRSR